jgi:hypothetical protein
VSLPAFTGVAGKVVVDDAAGYVPKAVTGSR